MNRSLYVIGLIVAFFSLTLLNAEAASPKSFRVKVKIDGDETVRSQVTSFINREIRALGDIEIVDSDPIYVISIVALTVENRNGNPLGYAISATVSMSLSRTFLSMRNRIESKANLSPEDVQFLKSFDDSIKEAESPKGHYLRTSDPQSLQLASQALIATIDADVFEFARKIMNDFEAFKRNQKTPTE